MAWKKVRLGDLITESRVPSLNPDANKRIKVKLKVLGVEKRPLENEIEGATKQFVRKAGQFIYGKQNFHKGAFGIIPNELDGYETSADLPAFDVNEKCIPEWIFYFFKQGGFYLELATMARGVATQRIHPEQIYDLEVPLPDLETQRNILLKLKSIEEKSASLSSKLFHQLNQLENLNQAILQEAVQGKLVKQDKKDEPASELLKRIKSEKVKSGKKEKPLPSIKAEEIPFDIPGNWVWCRLGEIILSLVGGGTPSKMNASFWNGSIPWASVKDLKDKFLYDTEDKISEIAIKGSSTNLIPANNIIVCTRMGLGKIAINKVETTINQDLKAIFLSSYVEQEYFYNFYKTLKIIGSGMTVNGIKQEQLLNYPFPLPPLSEQKRIVAEIEKQLAKTKQLKEHIIASHKATEQLLKALLHQAFEVEEMEEV